MNSVKLFTMVSLQIVFRKSWFNKTADLGTFGTFDVPDIVPSYVLDNKIQSNKINIAVIRLERESVPSQTDFSLLGRLKQ